MSIASAKIVTYTTPIEGMNLSENYDHAVCYYAKRYNSSMSSSADKHEIIDELINNNMWGPFCHLSISLSIKTTRDISRLFYDNYHIKMSTTKQEKNITETFGPPLEHWFELFNLQNKDYDSAKRMMYDIAHQAFTSYDRLIKQGVPIHIAKLVLPEGMTHMEFIASATLFGWINFVKETPSQNIVEQTIKNICATEISKLFPYINNFVK